MFNGIMNLMNSLEARYEKDMFDNLIEETENEYNILLTIDDIIIACSGLAIAAGGVLYFEDKQVTSILVDSHYLQMSETGKRFTIAHELGHIVYQLEKFKPGYVRNIDDEFEADEYAAKQLGLEMAIKGLEEVKAIMIKLECDVTEIDTRIENLMNKSIVTC